MSAMLTADWCPLGKNTYFRKFEVYSMAWCNEINFDNVTLAAAPFGGPVAVVRDRKKLVAVHGMSKPVISIYTGAGVPISSIVWNSGSLLQIGWSNAEELLCVQDDGAVLIYDIFGNYQHTFSMGQEAKDSKVVDVKFFFTMAGTGIAVLTSMYRIFLVNSVKELNLRQLAEIPGINEPLTSWIVIPEDRYTKVLAAKHGDLYSLKTFESHAIKVGSNITDKLLSVKDMSLSLNNKHIALFTENGIVWIGSSDLEQPYREFNTNNQTPPTQMVWCGTKAVICLWKCRLLLIGCNDDYINYMYDHSVFLSPELDGVRVLTATTHEIIQKVPPVVQKIFGINSQEPGSYLLEASKQYQKRSHRADEYIRLVKDKLDIAVQECIEAAGYEFDTGTQKLLVKAAQFGKSFVPEVDSEMFVKMCRNLRVLNAVRDSKVGIPLTYVQLQHLTIQVLLDRLVMRHHYFLAIQIAKYLKMPDSDGSSRILAHWACYKVKQMHLDEDQIAREIANKLGYAPGVSYSQIAKKATECGRKRLAIKLIDYEPCAILQVPLLLELGEEKKALVKAIESGDTDLVYTVILSLQKCMAVGEFQMAIRNFPMAQSLYVKLCQNHNQKSLRDIYVQEDDFNSQAACLIRESFNPKDSLTRDASLSAAHESYKRAKNEFCATLCEEQVRLLKYQRKLEEKFNQPFVGKSLCDTIEALLNLNEPKLADNLRSEYKLTDRRYWWIKLLFLASNSNWIEIEKMSKSKKSPIGYEAFVDACLKFGKTIEAQKYVSKVREEEKVRYYVKTGLLDEASRIAFEQKDIDALLFVQSNCSPEDRALNEKINTFVSQLGAKK